MTGKQDEKVKYFKYGAWLTGGYFALTIMGIVITPMVFEKPLGNAAESIGLNNIGDFFSGLFAPVAFLWLVITVLIQGKELALTRKEMEETRGVMKEQAEAANAHKRYVEQQTAIMKQQADLAVEAHQKNLQVALYDKRMGFYQNLKQYVDMCTRHIENQTVSQTHHETLKHYNVEAKAMFGQRSEVDVWVDELADRMFTYTGVSTVADRREYLIEWANLIKFEQFEEKFLPYINLVDEQKDS